MDEMQLQNGMLNEEQKVMEQQSKNIDNVGVP